MKRQRKPSPQTMRVLLSLLEHPTRWRHGYDLKQELGLKSGTLYPILIRLADQGLLETEWHDSAQPGLPPRHVYRLSPSGCRYIHAFQDCLGKERFSDKTGLAVS